MPNMLLGLILAFALTLPLAAHADDARASERVLTVYRNDVTVVQETYRIKLEAGQQTVRLSGVPAELLLDTLRLEPEDGVQLRSATLEPPLRDAAARMAHFVGEEVGLRSEGREARRPERVVIISADPPLVRGRHGIEAVDPARLVFPEDGISPYALTDTGLVLQLEVAEPDTVALALRYVLPGMGWSASHDAVLAAAGDEVAIDGRAVIRNRLSRALSVDRMELVAGTIRMPGTQVQPDATVMRTMEAGMPEPEAVGDLYRYAVESPGQLAAGRDVVLPLLERTAAADSAYQVRVQPWIRRGAASADDAGWRNVPVTTRVQWRNTDAPLPAGNLQIYRVAADGSLVLQGGVSVADTPADAMVSVEPGQPFDVTAAYRQVELERPEEQAFRSTEEVVVRNAGEQAVSVRLELQINPDWEFAPIDEAWSRPAADRVTRMVTVPGDAERKYRFHLSGRY